MGRGGKRTLSKVEMITCIHCGKTFQRRGIGMIPRFCSLECKQLNGREVYRTEHPKTLKALKCRHCGKRFESHSIQTKYCSSDCKKEANKINRPFHEKVCPECNGSFKTQDINQIHCSRTCATLSTREKLKKYYTCQHCHQLFSKDNAYRMKYCSRECAGQAKRLTVTKHMERLKIKQIHRSCQCCGKLFVTTLSYQIYCSNECGYNANLKQQREQWASEYTSKTFACKECGSKVVTECGKRFRSFCSLACQDRYYVRQHKLRRKEHMRLAYKEPVSFKRIYRRDKGLCGICGMPVPLDKSPSNIWGATIDHIKPLSRGGLHAMANCQLAHRLCNSMKVDVIDDFHIDWKAMNQKDGGKWTDYLHDYEMQMISETLPLTNGGKGS